MRYWLYQLLLWLLFPLLLYYSHRRCRQAGNRKNCWAELWGFNLPNIPRCGVWVHAVSLGEAQVALHLFRQLHHQNSTLPLFFTAGNRSALGVIQQAEDLTTLNHFAASYLPLDYRWIRKRLFKALQPRALILIETELWPNLLMTAHRASVPVVIVQARVSRKSKLYYPRYAQPLLGQLLAPVSFLAAQTEADRQFFVEMGANTETSVCLGNLKYDLPIKSVDIDLYGQLLAQLHGRWVWCAGSTHPQEEIPVLQAHQQLLQHLSNSVLILAPRHLKHLPEVYAYLDQQAMRWVTWSDFIAQDHLSTATQVIVIDQLGVLMLAYRLAQACFVGGSLIPWGGHNMLEPASLHKPIVAGLHNHNFAEIAESLAQAEALSLVNSATELSELLLNWVREPSVAESRGESAYQVFMAHQGATNRLLTMLEFLLTHRQ